MSEGTIDPLVDDQSDEIADVIEAMIRAGQAKIYTAIPAKIVSYEDGKAKVQPVVRARIGGAPTRLPVLSNIPVVWPSGGGQSIVAKLVKGDAVLLVFSKRSIDEYLASGQDDVTPASRRLFNINDAIAIPGLQSFNKPLANHGDGISIGDDTGIGGNSPPRRLEIDRSGGGIALGDGTDDVLKVVFDALTALSSTVVATSLGPQPLSSAATLASLATQIGNIKKY